VSRTRLGRVLYVKNRPAHLARRSNSQAASPAWWQCLFARRGSGCSTCLSEDTGFISAKKPRSQDRGPPGACMQPPLSCEQAVRELQEYRSHAYLAPRFRFVSPPPRELCCAICLRVPLDPRFHVFCRTLLCLGCAQSRPRCPGCQSPLLLGLAMPPNMISAGLETLPMRCEQCGLQPLPRQDCLRHLAEVCPVGMY
jgi:hypothetical protein